MAPEIGQNSDSINDPYQLTVEIILVQVLLLRNLEVRTSLDGVAPLKWHLVQSLS